MSKIVYLDNNATTRPLDDVVDAMLPLLREQYANPSSVHQFGQGVRHRIECARAQVAALIGSEPRPIVFTASGTESINLAIRGTLMLWPNRQRVVTSVVEHSAVHRLGKQFVREGCEVIEVGVDATGRIDLDAFAGALTDQTGLASVLWANNETGVLNDVASAVEIARQRGVPIHIDAVQAVGKVPIDVAALGCDLLSLSAHKFHGPKGVGALYVKPGARLRALIAGGRQERDLRAGTENPAGIVGMGVAAEVASRLTEADHARVAALRDRLEQGIIASAGDVRVNGFDAPRIANTTNMGFHGLQAEAILLLLSERGVCASAGAACSSGSLEPSHVLQAMGVPIEYAHGSIRFSLSRFTTEAEIDRVLEVIPEVITRLSALKA